MAPKGGNAKKESGRAKKAENETKKKESAALEKEKKEAAEWTDPKAAAKSSTKEEKEEKRKADLARKQENARLLAEEEAAAPVKVKAAPKAVKKAVAAKEKPAGPGAIAAGGGLGGDGAEKGKGADGEEGGKGKDKGIVDGEPELESYAATGIDNALDLLDVVTARMDKASVGQQAAGIERHPERRFKAAFEAYSERELPIARKEHPGLRLQQYKDLLYKQFQKSPENPFNQTVISYDATKEDKLDALRTKKAQIEERLRDKA